MVKIVWTELSTSDLKEIFDYIADDSIRYASITANKIYQRVLPITDNPYIGRIVPEFSEKTIRELIEGNYRIIYRIKSSSQVDILRVYHVARLLKKEEYKVIATMPNSVYNQLLGIKLQAVSLWVALVYLDTESLWQRK